MTTERTIVGACLLGSADVPTTTLSHTDFTSANLSTIFHCVQSLVAAGTPVSPETVALELGADLERIGGKLELLEIMGDGTRIGVERLCKAQADDALRRRIIEQATSLKAHAETGEDTDALLARASAIADTGASSSEAKTIHDIVDSMLPSMTEKREYYTLDPWGIRLYPGTVNLVGARPAVGKSAFALQSAQSLTERGVKTRIYSYEMSNDDWAERAIARTVGLTTEQIDDGLKDFEVDAVRHALKESWVSSLDVLDTIGWSLGRVTADMRRFARKGGKVAVIDYLQLMVTQNYDEVTEASRVLKTVARQTGLSLIVLSQLKRTEVNGKVRPPTESDLRQSGALEQDADIVILLHAYEPDDTAIREKFRGYGYLMEFDDPTTPYYKTLGHIEVAKSRRSRGHKFMPTWFDGAAMTWQEVDKTANGKRI